MTETAVIADRLAEILATDTVAQIIRQAALSLNMAHQCYAEGDLRAWSRWSGQEDAYRHAARIVAVSLGAIDSEKIHRAIYAATQALALSWRS